MNEKHLEKLVTSDQMYKYLKELTGISFFEYQLPAARRAILPWLKTKYPFDELPINCMNEQEKFEFLDRFYNECNK